MWEKLERTVLDNLSPEVQEDYGQDYILSERSFLNLMKTSTDPPWMLWEPTSRKDMFLAL